MIKIAIWLTNYRLQLSYNLHVIWARMSHFKKTFPKYELFWGVGGRRENKVSLSLMVVTLWPVRSIKTEIAVTLFCRLGSKFKNFKFSIFFFFFLVSLSGQNSWLCLQQWPLQPLPQWLTKIRNSRILSFIQILALPFLWHFYRIFPIL